MDNIWRCTFIVVLLMKFLCSVSSSCMHDGVEYATGSLFPTDEEECHVCRCDVTGDVTCNFVCKDCVVANKVYSHGDKVPADDDCNSCICMDGQLGCTLIGCNGGSGLTSHPVWLSTTLFTVLLVLYHSLH